MSFNNDKAMLGDKFRALLKMNNIHPVVKEKIKELHYTVVSSNASKNAKSNALTELNRFFVKYGVGSVFNGNGKRVGGRRTKRARRSARKTRRHSRRA